MELRYNRKRDFFYLVDERFTAYVMNDRVELKINNARDTLVLTEIDIKEIGDAIKGLKKQKICKTCKRKFVPKRQSKKFCSDSCRTKFCANNKENLGN